MKTVEVEEHEIKMKGKRPLPEGWRLVKLGEMCEIIAGQSPPSETYRRSPEGIPFFQGKADFGPRYPVAQIWCVAPIKIAQSGDILISIRAPVGPTNIADVECCIGRGLAAIRPGNYADGDFILAVLKFSESKLAALGSGSTFDAIKRNDLESLTIPLPPLSEQKRIAAILNEQMSAVAKARDATAAQLEAAKTLPAAYLRAIFQSLEAQEWPRMKIRDICSLVIDGPHVTPVYVSKGVPFLTVRNIVNRKIDLSSVSYISPIDHSKFCRRARAERGDILYTKDGTMGIPCVVETDLEFGFFVSVALIKLLHDRVDPHFVAFALESPFVLQQVKLLGAGAGLKHMVLKSIKALTLPLPNLIEQKQITAQLSEQMAEAKRVRKALEDQLGAINKLPATLLQRAFSGEL